MVYKFIYLQFLVWLIFVGKSMCKYNLYGSFVAVKPVESCPHHLLSKQIHQ